LIVAPIFDAAGRIIGASSIARDITKRKEAEDALRQSEARLERSQAFSLVMTAHIGLDGRWIKAPPRLCELFGYSEAEMLARRSEDVTHPEDRDEERNLCRDLIDGRIKSVDMEKRCITRDGRVLPVYLNYSIVTDMEGAPVRFLAYIRDITKRRTAEEELKQTNAYLENVLENSPDAIGIVDEHGKFIKWNKMAAELYGYSFEELRGKSGFDLYADRDEMESMLMDLRRQGSVKKREMLMKRKNGGIAPSEISIGLLQDREGRVLGSVSVGRDLSEIKDALVELKASNERLSNEIVVRKRAEEEVQWLSRKNQLILDAAGEGIVGYDLKGRVTFINPAGAELAGYRIEELIQKDFHQMVHHSRPDGAPYPAHECPMFESLSTGVALRERDEVFWRKDGTSFPVAYSSTPLFEEGRIVGGVLTFRDITLRTVALEELSKYHDHLEELVKERTMELAMANEQLTREIEERKRAEEALKLFAYSVAHDLKSPAIGIYGMTRRLNKQFKDVLDEKGRNYCEQILKISEHIAALVEKINVYIVTKEARPLFEKINIKEVLTLLKDEFSAQLNIRRIEWFEPESDIEIIADRLSITRAFRNFVDNALKYGGERLSNIWIGHEETENAHIFSITDNGKGLKGMDAEKIFGLFQRHETSRGVEGAGLGLAIVREIAQQHGGQVWVEPTAKKGTTFCISVSKNL
jgi:PAS domain S-box-containing protein